MIYNVWMEGYQITGNSSDAQLLGSTDAESFQEACDLLLVDENLYDSERLVVWGCRLYDNEIEARKSFG